MTNGDTGRQAGQEFYKGLPGWAQKFADYGSAVSDFATHGISEALIFWTPEEIQRAMLEIGTLGFADDEAAGFIQGLKGEADADSWYRSIAKYAGMGAGFALSAGATGGAAAVGKAGAKLTAKQLAKRGVAQGLARAPLTQVLKRTHPIADAAALQLYRRMQPVSKGGRQLATGDVPHWLRRTMGGATTLGGLHVVHQAGGHIPLPAPTEGGWSIVPKHQRDTREWLRNMGALEDFESWAKRNRVEDPYSSFHDYVGAFIDGGNPEDPKYKIGGAELVGNAIADTLTSAGAGAIGGALGAAIGAPRLISKTVTKQAGWKRRNLAQATELLSMQGSQTFLTLWRKGDPETGEDLTVREAARRAFTDKENFHAFIGFFTTMGLAGKGQSLFFGKQGVLRSGAERLAETLATAAGREAMRGEADPLRGNPDHQLATERYPDDPGMQQVFRRWKRAKSDHDKANKEFNEFEENPDNHGRDNPFNEKMADAEARLDYFRDALETHDIHVPDNPGEWSWSIGESARHLARRMRIERRLTDPQEILTVEERAKLLRNMEWIDSGLDAMEMKEPEITANAALRRAHELAIQARQLNRERVKLESSRLTEPYREDAAKQETSELRIQDQIDSVDREIEGGRRELQFVRRLMSGAEEAWGDHAAGDPGRVAVMQQMRLLSAEVGKPEALAWRGAEPIKKWSDLLPDFTAEKSDILDIDRGIPKVGDLVSVKVEGNKNWMDIIYEGTVSDGIHHEVSGRSVESGAHRSVRAEEFFVKARAEYYKPGYERSEPEFWSEDSQATRPYSELSEADLLRLADELPSSDMMLLSTRALVSKKMPAEVRALHERNVYEFLPGEGDFLDVFIAADVVQTLIANGVKPRNILKNIKQYPARERWGGKEMPHSAQWIADMLVVAEAPRDLRALYHNALVKIGFDPLSPRQKTEAKSLEADPYEFQWSSPRTEFLLGMMRVGRNDPTGVWHSGTLGTEIYSKVFEDLARVHGGSVGYEQIGVRVANYAEQALIRGDLGKEASVGRARASRDAIWDIAHVEAEFLKGELRSKEYDVKFEAILKRMGWEGNEFRANMAAIPLAVGPIAWATTSQFLGAAHGLNLALGVFSKRYSNWSQARMEAMDAKILSRVDPMLVKLESTVKNYWEFMMGNEMNPQKIGEGFKVEPGKESKMPKPLRNALRWAFGVGPGDAVIRNEFSQLESRAAKLLQLEETAQKMADKWTPLEHDQVELGYNLINSRSEMEVRATYFWLKNKGIPRGRYEAEALLPLEKYLEAWREWHPEKEVAPMLMQMGASQVWHGGPGKAETIETYFDRHGNLILKPSTRGGRGMMGDDPGSAVWFSHGRELAREHGGRGKTAEEGAGYLFEISAEALRGLEAAGISVGRGGAETNVSIIKGTGPVVIPKGKFRIHVGESIYDSPAEYLHGAHSRYGRMSREELIQEFRTQYQRAEELYKTESEQDTLGLEPGDLAFMGRKGLDYPAMWEMTRRGINKEVLEGFGLSKAEIKHFEERVKETEESVPWVTEPMPRINQRKTRLRDMVTPDGLFSLVPEVLHHDVEFIRRLGNAMGRAMVRDGDISERDFNQYEGAYMTRWYRDKMLNTTDFGRVHESDIAAVAESIKVSPQALTEAIRQRDKDTARKRRGGLKHGSKPDMLTGSTAEQTLELASLFPSTLRLDRKLSSLGSLMADPRGVGERLDRQIKISGARIITQRMARNLINRGEAKLLTSEGARKKAKEAGWVFLNPRERGVKDTFGHLTGHWVRKHVAKELRDHAKLRSGQIHEDGHWFIKEMRGMASIGNVAVTALTPGTHFTQVIGNQFIMNLAGVPARDLYQMNKMAIGDVIQALKGTNTELYALAQKHELFKAEELFYQLGLDPRYGASKTTKSEMEKHGKKFGITGDVVWDITAINKFKENAQRNGYATAVNEVIMNMMSGVPSYFQNGKRVTLNGQGLRTMYMIQDRIAKLGIFRHLIENRGMDPRQAAEEVGWYYDYGKVPDIIRKSRPWFAFATFPYLVTRGIAKTARRYPTRVANQFLWWNLTLPMLSKLMWGMDNPEDEDLSQYSRARDRVNWINPATGFTARTLQHNSMTYMGRDENGNGMWINLFKYNPFHSGPEKVESMKQMLVASVPEWAGEVFGIPHGAKGGMQAEDIAAAGNMNPFFHRLAELYEKESWDAGDPSDNNKIQGLGRILEHGLLTVGLPPNLYAIYNKLAHNAGPYARAEYKDDKALVRGPVRPGPTGLARFAATDNSWRQGWRMWGGVATTDDSQQTANQGARFFGGYTKKHFLAPHRNRLVKVILDQADQGLGLQEAMGSEDFMNELTELYSEKIPEWNAQHPRGAPLTINDVLGPNMSTIHRLAYNQMLKDISPIFSRSDEDFDKQEIWELSQQNMLHETMNNFSWWD